MRRSSNVALWTLLLVGGCVPPLSAAPVRPFPPSPVELRCVRTTSGAPQITLRNRTGRALEVKLLGLAYAGRAGLRPGRSGSMPDGIWEHWWTQHGIQLPPHGTWSALLYEIRGEKVEVRDRQDRLLAGFNLMRNLPAAPWEAAMALHSRTDWQPFARLERFGQNLAGELRPGWPVTWRTIRPPEAPLQSDRYFGQVRVVGDVSAAALTPQQLAALRHLVQRGRTLILCGGTDLAWLRGGEHAGFAAAPAQGTRTIAGLRCLTQRYGTPALRTPLSVADVGVVPPPARVVLEEQGVPLIVERPMGAGTLLLVTFDPTRPPFRGSALEKPFWQEWLGRGEGDFTGIYAGLDQAARYRQAQERLGLLPPPMRLMTGAWIAYLLVLVLVLAAARRRILWLLAVSLGGSLLALAVGPLTRGLRPVASLAGLLSLQSGEGNGWWRGQASVMVPGSGLVTLRVPDGSADTWDAPRLRLLPSPYIVEQPRLRRWMPTTAQIDAPADLRGSVAFDLELEGDAVSARVRNRTSHRLKDAVVVWGRAALLSLGELPPGSEVRRRLARVGSDGTAQGAQGRLPEVFGQTGGFSNTPDSYYWPLLLARTTPSGRCPPGGPAPTLLVNEHPIREESHMALMVAPSGFRARGSFRLPAGAAPGRLVRADQWQWSWFQGRSRGLLELAPRGWAEIEFGLPAGAGLTRWRRLALRLDREVTLSTRLQVFDWSRQRWVPVMALSGRQPSPPPAGRFVRRWFLRPSPSSFERRTVALPFPARLVNRYTDTLLARVENTGGYSAATGIEVTGRGEAP